MEAMGSMFIDEMAAPTEDKEVLYGTLMERQKDPHAEEVQKVQVDFRYGADPLNIAKWNLNFPPTDYTAVEALGTPWIEGPLSSGYANMVCQMARQTLKSNMMAWTMRALGYTGVRALRQLCVSGGNARQRDAFTDRLMAMLDGFYVSKCKIDLGQSSEEEEEAFRPVHVLMIDELQRLSARMMSKVELAAAPQVRRYAGTPAKGYTVLDMAWSNSSQNEWLVPCDHCGGGQLHFWNVLDGDNVREGGLSCKRCGKALDWTQGQWVTRYSNKEWDGWRVSQLMCVEPQGWIPWEKIWLSKENFPPHLFHSEVLGLRFEEGGLSC